MLDPNKQWMRSETTDGIVVRVWCHLCSEHQERLRRFRNFSEAFISGITGTALKKDALVKQSNTAAHLRAQSLHNGPIPLNELFQKTPIGKQNYVRRGACIALGLH